MQTLDTLVPFIGIVALLWAFVALISAIFPGNRRRRLVSSGIAFVVFVVAIVSSPSIENAAEKEELIEVDVSSKKELTELQAEQEADEIANALTSYVEQVTQHSQFVNDMSVKDFTESIDEIIIAVQLFSDWAEIVDEGREFDLTAEQERMRQNLKTGLARKQAQVMPALRDAYGPLLRQQLWEHDGYARTIDSGFRRIEIVNPMFATNRNILAFHEKARETLLQLRFTRVDYKWFRQASEYSYFSLEPPADNSVGFWQGGRFHPVE